MERINYLDFPNCFRLSNDTIEIVVTTDIGPRIIFYGFAGEANILGEHPHAAVETALGTWKPYGGHRLWIAPEENPRAYAPDNAPVEYEFDADRNSIHLTQPFEAATGTQKEMIVSLDKEGSGVRIKHRITNRGAETIELAPWPLTIMRGGGEVTIPNEPRADYSPQTLLPVRSFAVWSYTDFTDSRWRFEADSIRLRVDDAKHNPQKIGVLNKQGWAAYRSENLLFIKRFPFLDNATYPDMNSNCEIYTAGAFVEIESLAPLNNLVPGDAAEHAERWELRKIGNSDELNLSDLVI